MFENMLEGELAVISNSLNNSEISFPIRQLCAYWQPCPSSSLEINLFPAVLALHGKSDSSAFTSGSSHQQNVNYKSKTIYCIEREKQFPRQSKLCLSLSILFTPFSPQSVAGQNISHWGNSLWDGEE